MSNAVASDAPASCRSSVKAPSGQLSAAIGVARVVCIISIVYVHAWTGLGGRDLAATSGTPQGVLRWMLMELFGRGSVPLLGMISGYLVMSSARKGPWITFLARKARTILAPMVLWNALAILFVCGAAYIGVLEAPIPRTWWWTVNELLCLATPDNINVQIAFLRDLFVCMAMAPLLSRLPKPWLLACAAGALVWMVSGFSCLLLLRPSILCFFILGMLARGGTVAERVALLPLAVTAVPYILIAVVRITLAARGVDIGASHPWQLVALDVLMRFAAAVFFWSMAWRLAASRAAGSLLQIEAYAFLMFCGHLIMIWLGGPLIGKVTGPLGSPLYPVFLLLQPVLVLIATLLLGRFLMRRAPAVAAILSGNRLRAA